MVMCVQYINKKKWSYKNWLLIFITNFLYKLVLTRRPVDWSRLVTIFKILFYFRSYKNWSHWSIGHQTYMSTKTTISNTTRNMNTAKSTTTKTSSLTTVTITKRTSLSSMTSFIHVG